MKTGSWSLWPLGLLVMACGGQSESDPAGGTGGSAGGGAVAGSGGAGAVAGTSGGGGVPPGGTGGAPPSGGAPGIAPECTVDGDCTLFSDCCSCIGIPSGSDEPYGCDMACAIDSCSAAGIKQARCAAGRCVAGFECDPMKSACFSMPPVCPPGRVPSVVGACWGPCVDVTQCSGVPSCAECMQSNAICVQLDLQGGDTSLSAHCVKVPDACSGNATCQCMGSSVCVAPYSACQDFSGIKGMACSCPNC